MLQSSCVHASSLCGVLNTSWASFAAALLKLIIYARVMWPSLSSTSLILRLDCLLLSVIVFVASSSRNALVHSVGLNCNTHLEGSFISTYRHFRLGSLIRAILDMQLGVTHGHDHSAAIS